MLNSILLQLLISNTNLVIKLKLQTIIHTMAIGPKRCLKIFLSMGKYNKLKRQKNNYCFAALAYFNLQFIFALKPTLSFFTSSAAT